MCEFGSDQKITIVNLHKLGCRAQLSEIAATELQRREIEMLVFRGGSLAKGSIERAIRLHHNLSRFAVL